MKTCNLTFEHTVQGRAVLIDSTKRIKRVLTIESDEDHVVRILLEGLSEGRWIVRFVGIDDWMFECTRVVTLSRRELIHEG